MQTTDEHSVNAYQTPTSDVTESVASTDGGSLETALAGDYDFQIGEICSRAWELVRGAKLPVLGAVLVSYLLQLGSQWLVLSLGLMEAPEEAGSMSGIFISSLLLGLLTIPVTYPLTVGMMIYGVRRAAGQNPRFGEFFRYYPRLLILTGLALVNMVAIYLGAALLIIPGIYLSIAMIFAAPLLVDRDMGVFEALITSIKIVNHRWFGFFGLFLLVGLVVLLSVLPLMIGLIWSLPWALLVYGVIYHHVVGVNSVA